MNDTIAEQGIDRSVFDQWDSRKQSNSMKWDRYADKDVIPMWVADMDFRMAEPIQKALELRLQHPFYGYTVAPDTLREAIVKHLKTEHDWQIEADWLVFLPGVVTGMAICCRTFCADNDEVMVNPPIYHHFYDSHDDKRQTLVKVPLHKQDGRWTYDLPSMRAKCSDKLSMLLMCSPQNPTGTVFTREELRSVAAMCEEHDMTIVSDEIHCDLVIDGKSKHVPTALACPEQSDRIITLMSASKTWNLAGLNTSFAIIPNATRREQFQAGCQSVVPLVPPLALTASEAALVDGGPWRQALLQYLNENYERIRVAIDNMPGLKLEPLQATYLGWIDATELGLENTQAYFEEHGVGLSSGEQFGQPQFLRINFACPAAMLEESLDRMRKAVELLA